MANQNVTQLSQQTVSANTSSLFYAVTSGTTDTGLPLSVLVNNLGLTGVPTVPTATTGTNTTQIASTAFVQAQNTATLAAYAPLAGATFTGVVTYGFSNANIILNDTSGTGKTFLTFKNNGTTVWDWSNTSTGGTFSLDRWVSGSFVDAPISVNNVTGVVTMVDGIAGTNIGVGGPGAGAFTTLSANNTVSGSGFSTYLASPPAIGGTVAAAGKFTTLQATSTITPSTTAGIVGTTLADAAQAGSVGEVITASVASGSAIALTTGTAANVTSISLTAGDWDVWGQISYVPAGSTVMSSWSATVETTSASFPPANLNNVASQYFPITLGAGQGPTVHSGTLRVNVSTTTSVFLVAYSAFSTSTNAAYGYITARRRR